MSDTSENSHPKLYCIGADVGLRLVGFLAGSNDQITSYLSFQCSNHDLRSVQIDSAFVAYS